MTIRTAALVFTLASSVTLLATPSFAVEPDVKLARRARTSAPRTDRPDFQQDDQAGAAIDPQAEGADPTPPSAYAEPEVIIPDPAAPIPR